MHRYCLTCFEPLDDEAPACSRGHRYVPAVTYTYWNRHPVLVVTEQLLKIAAVWAAIGTTLWMRYANDGAFLEHRPLWVLTLPTLGAFVLWRCASKLTRHDSRFRPSWLGGAAGLVLMTRGIHLYQVDREGAPESLGLGALVLVVTWVVRVGAARCKHALTGGALEPDRTQEPGSRAPGGGLGGRWSRPKAVPDGPGITPAPVNLVGPTHVYCLECFEALEEGADVCPRGHRDRPADRRVFWNRNPRLVAMERALKAVIVALGVLGTLGLLASASGPAAGWFFLLPAMGAYGLWRCASKLTHHDYNFRPRYLLAGAGGVLGFGGLLLTLGGVGGGVVGLMTGPALAFGAFAMCDEAERWKRGLIESHDPEATERRARLERRLR